jgi:hypothetical protein
MPSTAKQAETTAYENVRCNPFTRMHGRPTQSNYSDEIREDIRKIVRVSANADKTRKQLAEMVAQLKALTAAVTQLAAMKENANPNATRGNEGGDCESQRPHWPTATRVAIKQQDHPTGKGTSAPTNGQGLGTASRVNSNAEFLKQSLATNYYACLSPPLHQAHNNNMRDSTTTSWQYIIGEDDDLLWRGMENGTIPSMVVDSGCTSGVGTSDNLCQRTHVQEEICSSWWGDSQCHRDREIPVQGQGAGTRATHHTRRHQKLIVEHQQVCRRQLHHNV